MLCHIILTINFPLIEGIDVMLLTLLNFPTRAKLNLSAFFLASCLSYFGQSTAESQHLIPYTAVDNTECKSVVRQVM